MCLDFLVKIVIFWLWVVVGVRLNENLKFFRIIICCVDGYDFVFKSVDCDGWLIGELDFGLIFELELYVLFWFYEWCVVVV